LLLRQTVPDAVQAIAVARRQNARSWELRAAVSLSRLWQQQGQREEAREPLASTYGWFTKGSLPPITSLPPAAKSPSPLAHDLPEPLHDQRHLDGRVPPSLQGYAREREIC
jgi:hypothetical protein